MASKVYHLDNNNGVSHNTIYSILQDRQGFLWFATESGLNKYDGYGFKTYLNENDNKYSISENFLLQIIEDSKGTIWLATNGGGISKFNKETEQFTNYIDSSNLKKMFQNNSVWCILEGEKNRYWLGTFGGGLKKFNAITGKIEKHYNASMNSTNSITNDDVRHIVKDARGNIWVATFGGGFNKFDPQTEQFTSYKLQDKSNGADDIICLLNDDKAQCLWVGTYGNGLYRLDKKTNELRKYDAVKSQFIRSILIDPTNEDVLWIATWGDGVLRFNTKNGKIEEFRNNLKNEFSLSDNHTLSLWADRAGLIWVGTYNAGVNKINTFPERFQTLTKASENGLSSNVVSSIFEENNQVWISTNGGGLNKWSRKENQIIIYKNDKKSKNSISNNVTHVVLKEHDNLWIGTGNGLDKWNLKTNNNKVYLPDSTDKNALSYNSITSGYRDKQGVLWFGTYGGLNKYDPKKDNFVVYKNKINDPASLSENTVLAMLEDHKHNFWLGTGKGGLNLMNRMNGTFEHFNDNALRFGQCVNVIAEDSVGQIWVGTTNGLVKLSIDAHGKYQTSVYTIKDSLPSNYVSGILVDAKSNLWVSSTKGIYKFIPPSNVYSKPHITIYGKEDGIENTEFSPGACYAGSSGLFYFGSVGGLVMFYPDSIKRHGLSPQIAITGFRIFNEPVGINPTDTRNSMEVIKINDNYFLSRHISTTAQIVLSYRENVFSFDFAALDFLYPNKNQFAYRMDGFEEHWNYVGNKNSATYTNLSPGKYTFHVKGTNSDGVWSTNDAIISIIITPPWWATWWFRISALLFILCTTVYLIRRRINKLQREKRLLEERVEERTQEIKQQKDEVLRKAMELMAANEKLREMEVYKETLTSMIIHDLKNPLGSIVNIAAVNNKEENSRLIELAAKQMLNLVMNILDVQKLKESKITLNTKQVSLLSLIRNATNYLALSLKQKNISVKYEVSENITVCCDRDLMERVFINLLSNAIYYSPLNAAIIVRSTEGVTSAGKYVAIAITDSGAGMNEERLNTLFDDDNIIDKKADKYSTGIGLQYCKWVLSAHNSEIKAKSELGIGTTFYFSLPVEEKKEPMVMHVPHIIERPKIALTSTEITILLSYAHTLKEHKVYEGGKILKILEKIKEDTESIVYWKQNVKQAVFSINQEYYELLIFQIINNAS